MNLPPAARHLLVPAAWLGTALLTFCIGRMSSYIDPPSNASAANAHIQKSATPEASAHLSATAISTSARDTFASLLEELTGGQSIGDWLKRVLKQEDEIARMSGFMRLLDLLNTGEEIAQALDAVSIANNGWTRGREFSMLLQKWAQLDPAKAMAYVQASKSEEARSLGYRAVLSTWTRRDPQQAIAWAKQDVGSSSSADGNWAVATIVGQLAKTDPDWALRLTQEETRSVARGRMVEAVIGQFLSQRGEAAAGEMVMAIPEETLRQGMMARLAGQLAASNPAAAAQWVGTLPAGEGRQRALTELVGQWSEKDPAAAATYLGKFPISPETDESRGVLARKVVRDDPEGALAWASTISEDQFRTRAVTDLVRNWLRRDADAAGKWVQASQLPVDVKARLGFPAPGTAPAITR